MRRFHDVRYCFVRILPFLSCLMCAVLVYVQGYSRKIAGHNKSVEIDESKFGRRKYHRGHAVEGQWVFGGVEREFRKTFLSPVRDRPADTFMAVTKLDWTSVCIEPGTTVLDGVSKFGRARIPAPYDRCLWWTGARTNKLESTVAVLRLS